VKFELSQNFDAPAATVIGVYCDPDFYPALDGVGQIGDPSVLSRDEKGNTIVMRVRFRFTGNLPSAALAIVKPERLTWVEETTYDLDQLTARSQIHPDHYADRLQASATSHFQNTPGGSTRSVSGDLKVHALLVGGQVEKAIVSGMREHFVDEERVVATRL
jgi:hypothetical protein